MDEAGAVVRNANDIIESQLTARAYELEQFVRKDVLAFVGPMYSPADDVVKDLLEGITSRRQGLLVILETDGGLINVTERIATILRHLYRRVEFLVPSYAMSAGTVLVMSGDAIFMDYASVLGPIDPQVNREHGLVPALGYIEQYERLINKSALGQLTTAEAMWLTERFDPAELYRFEQERELTIALLKDWLVKYKFKNWTTTEHKHKSVTAKMREKRAEEIATKLNTVSLWHSHARGISMEVLRRDLNLRIDDFGKRPRLRGLVHDYYRLLQDYRMRMGHQRLVMHTGEQYVGY